MKSAIQTIAFTAFFLITAGCNNHPKSFTERKLVIARNETVKVPELELSITNKGCVREWVAGGGTPGTDRAYCNLIIKRKDSTILGGGDFKPVYIGNAEIMVEKINPWNREEDSVPAGGCQVLVRKVEGW